MIGKSCYAYLAKRNIKVELKEVAPRAFKDFSAWKKMNFLKTTTNNKPY